MKVLIAEDDPTTRELVRRLIAAAGSEVVIASNGEEALELARREQPDIVLTDWMMPGLNGVELCQQLRSAAPGQPYVYVILLTVRDEKEDISRALDEGADDYIVKPFDAKELMARVRAGERIVRLETMLRHRNEELEESLQTIRQLKSLLPICVFCKRIRTDENYWQQIEAYIHQQTGTDFSHGICPECFEKHYPDYYHKMRDRKKCEDKAPPNGSPPPRK